MKQSQELCQRQSSFHSVKTKLFSDENGAKNGIVDPTLPTFHSPASPSRNNHHAAPKHMQNGNGHRNGSAQQASAILRRASGSAHRPKRFVTLLVSLIVLSSLSFVYVALVMEMDNFQTTTLDDGEFDAPKEQVRRNTTHNPPHRRPPDATSVISSLNKRNSTNNKNNGSKHPPRPSSSSTASWKGHPRIVAIPIDATSLISKERLPFQFQYERVKVPKEQIPPSLNIGNRTWDEFLELPTTIISEENGDQQMNDNNTTNSAIRNSTNMMTDSMSTHLRDSNDDTCLPMAKWMTASFVNCNSMHEIDLMGSVAQHDQTDLVLLGEGWFRSTWKYSVHNDLSPSSTVVVKTLRIEREFLEEYFELHRRDAVAMERLTFSPFVMDVYGYEE
jgi:hypothetical protein